MIARFLPKQRQLELLRFITGYQLAHRGVSPRLDDCAQALGIHKSNIHRLLEGLQERGLIRRLPNRERAIDVLAPPPVPMIGDRITAALKQWRHGPSLCQNIPAPGSSNIDEAAVAVMEERRRQIERYGHDAEADDGKPRAHLLHAAHVRLLDACDLVTGKREDLIRAQRKIVQAAALCLAEFDRIERQLNPKGDRAHD